MPVTPWVATPHHHRKRPSLFATKSNVSVSPAIIPAVSRRVRARGKAGMPPSTGIGVTSWVTARLWGRAPSPLFWNSTATFQPSGTVTVMSPLPYPLKFIVPLLPSADATNTSRTSCWSASTVIHGGVIASSARTAGTRPNSPAPSATSLKRQRLIHPSRWRKQRGRWRPTSLVSCRMTALLLLREPEDVDGVAVLEVELEVPAGGDRDELLAVHLVGDRGRVDAGAGVEPPQLFPRLRVEGVEVAGAVTAGEDDSA